MFEVQKVSFSYSVGGRTIDVLKELDFSVKAGEFIGIQGPSGSGKSTLFYILGFLLKPTHGKITFDGIDITQVSSDELAAIRNRRIGFIFQQFHLLSNSSCLKNILLPTLYPAEIAQKDQAQETKARDLAAKLGLSEHLLHFPNQLSGGQQQRVAIARALIHDVELILADEPTGNLDSKSAAQTMELLKDLNRQGKTIILITHDSEIAKYCSKVYHLRDGAFTHIEENYHHKSLPEKEIRRKPLIPQQSFLKRTFKILWSTLPLALENLLRNKVKSLLTMLGVIIGVAAVLAMMTLGEFSRVKILETYESLGINKLLIHGYPNPAMKATDVVAMNFKSFNLDRDLLPLRHVFPEIELISPPFSIGPSNATVGGITIDNKVETMGVNSEYLWIANRSLIAGTNISPYHVENGSPVCVIGYDIVEQLFSRTSALGQMLNVADSMRLNFNCRVIGVLASQTSAKDFFPPNLNVLIPYTYFQTIAPNWWFSQAHAAVLQVKAGENIEDTGLKVRAYFEQKYGKSGLFIVDADSALIAQMKKFLNIFTMLLTAIALLSLLVGGIGINNMILVSVTERIKEFGIRKALGATNRSIRFQVLLESLAICTLAGIIGVVLGFCSYELLIFAATKLVPGLQFEWFFLPFAIFLSFCSITLVGILSGLVPAIRAEKLQIIEALRTE